MNCRKCKKIKRITKNQDARCLKHGIILLINKMSISLQPAKSRDGWYHIKVRG